jgi:hypothetical protein
MGFSGLDGREITLPELMQFGLISASRAVLKNFAEYSASSRLVAINAAETFEAMAKKWEIEEQKLSVRGES